RHARTEAPGQSDCHLGCFQAGRTKIGSEQDRLQHTHDVSPPGSGAWRPAPATASASEGGCLTVRHCRRRFFGTRVVPWASAPPVQSVCPEYFGWYICNYSSIAVRRAKSPRFPRVVQRYTNTYVHFLGTGRKFANVQGLLWGPSFLSEAGPIGSLVAWLGGVCRFGQRIGLDWYDSAHSHLWGGLVWFCGPRC